MSLQRVTEEELLAYVCGEVDETRSQAIRCALEDSPELAAQAAELLVAFGSLQGTIDSEDVAFVLGEAAEVEQDANKAEAFRQSLLEKLANEGETGTQEIRVPDTVEDARSARIRFNERLRRKWKTCLEAGSSRERRWRLWARWLPASAAACVGVGLLVWLLFFPSTSATVYAITDMRSRIEQLESVYFRYRVRDGVTDPAHMDTNPIFYVYEAYYERSGRMFIRNESKFWPYFFACDGEQYVQASHGPRQWKSGKVDILYRKYSNAINFIDVSIKLCGNPSVPFEYLRTEMSDGKSLDVYQQVNFLQKGGYLKRIVWFDATSGYPIKLERYEKKKKGKERLTVIADAIKPNAIMPFDEKWFEPVEGYTIEYEDQIGDKAYHCSHLLNGRHFKIYRSFSIDDKAILVGWSFTNIVDGKSYELGMDRTHNEVLHVVPSKHEEQWQYVLHEIQNVPYDGGYWRWSLVIPEISMLNDREQRYLFEYFAADKPMGLYTSVPLLDDQLFNDTMAAPFGPRHPDGRPMTVDDFRKMVDDLQKSDEDVGPTVQ